MLILHLAKSGLPVPQPVKEELTYIYKIVGFIATNFKPETFE